MSIDLNSYQDSALSTAVYPGQQTREGILYTALGLTGEAGEYANKVSKLIRDAQNANDVDTRLSLADELGDVMYFVAMAAHELGIDLEVIAAMNIDKLAVRQAAGTIHGSGDHR